ncbi:hypothetical protein D5086_033520 [Populus alba]|uniref:Uncharacterized protein n=1 Tax=Populus alba TaxID=43335 RepID=A0ACC4AHR1_POPAL
MAAVPMTTEKISEYLPKNDEEACPICQEKLNNQKMHTDFGNIAYADDRRDKSCSSAMLDAIQGCEKTEASLAVQGSYGTKLSNLLAMSSLPTGSCYCFISKGESVSPDQPLLTLKDVESLFTTVPSTVSESDGKTTENLRHLPPSVAAALAAERRLKENTAGISV